MKFINAEFFYNSSELINEDLYSYWWFLMGIPSNSVDAKDGLSSVLDDLRIPGKKSYTINSSTDVLLNNACICGMLKAKTPVIPTEANEPENKGKVILTAESSNEDSKIPFTVGQEKKDDGHIIDSLWLVRLSKEITNDEISNFFPFELVGVSTTSTHIYKGFEDEYDIRKCKALIGYSVSSSNNEIVNAMNFSGFTVGKSTITISGLVDESEK